MGSEVWPLVHAERAALIADLEGIDAAQWETPSLCDGWTVHDVAAHLVNTARTTRLGFLLTMVGAGFDFDRQNARGVARARGATPEETLERLREVATLTKTPPAPLDTRLVEEVVHGEDVRRPLGIKREYPSEAVARALRVHTGMSASMGGAKELTAGIRLAATDTDLVVGDGPEVRGPAASLLLAVSGRRVALSELDGPGLARLESA
ncbi:maleylpyruvate isomerase family mycothiol-dependent enzyme [Glycomyces sp. NPDC047010]|uniref:maleylpyruvate isomerase family mycothiol-dependent enzyme n=1 Tax=Glycomyces sp. NPDC047010 TaxID=3155023 RepID=UPI0033FC32EB